MTSCGLFRKIFLFANLLPFLVFAQSTKKILFLGNSYTYVNNLPQITADIASSMGDSLLFDSNTPGGYTLQGHSTNTTSISKIQTGNWDYVVLQEQSQLPSFPDSQVQTDVFPYAHFLDSVINAYNPCAETMFYMTWGRKNGDASNCASWPPVCTYTGMDSLLHLHYMMMAENNHAVVSPVGAVWKYIRKNFPTIELYQSDESHPSVYGSYAAACSFYTAMFRKNPLLITYNFSIPDTDAIKIRTAVKAVVYDSLLNWHIGEYDPVANFTFATSANNTATFNNTSSNAINYEWYFSDGSSSSDTNPVHIYASSGLYQVTLIAHYCNYSDTIIQTVNATSTGIENIFSQNKIKLFPNPVNDYVFIDIQNLNIRNISIVDCLGKIYSPNYFIENHKIKIDCSSLPSGIYILKIITEDNVITRKIIKG